ncbi:MAG: helix-turn-helix transcriptional regulator, partial [Clostridia bacterium]|nr:helix-turn-helix transcriptional regulator [Clostridia bacterium]
NLHNPLPNKLLAKQLHMQTNHFIRYFKERLGQTPQKYIMAKRMDFAKHLLLDDELTLAEIADRTGFCDSAHFSKNFKTFYSMAPGLYKKYFSGR